MGKRRRHNPYSQDHYPRANIRKRLTLSYFSLIRRGVHLLRHLHLPTAASIFGGLFAEPGAVAIALSQPQERKDTPLSLHGLNPTRLTPKQSLRPPVLLLAGKRANPAIMIGLAQTLSHHPLTRHYPLFTCQWGGRAVNQAAKEAVLKRIEEIRLLYPDESGQKVKVTLVGHSMGALVAAEAAIEFTNVKRFSIRPEIGQLILIGHPLTAEVDPEGIDPKILDRVYEIDGIHDVLVDGRSCHPNPSHRVSIPCGHLGLTQFEKATQYVAYFVARQSII